MRLPGHSYFQAAPDSASCAVAAGHRNTACGMRVGCVGWRKDARPGGWEGGGGDRDSCCILMLLCLQPASRLSGVKTGARGWGRAAVTGEVDKAGGGATRGPGPAECRTGGLAVGVVGYYCGIGWTAGEVRGGVRWHWASRVYVRGERGAGQAAGSTGEAWVGRGEPAGTLRRGRGEWE